MNIGSIRIGDWTKLNIVMMVYARARSIGCFVPINAVNEAICKKSGKNVNEPRVSMIYDILMNWNLSSLVLFSLIIPLNILIQEYSLIILILFKLSVVTLIRASVSFMYFFWFLALHLEIEMLTRRDKTNTAIPAKKVQPRYLNRNEKQRVSVKGRVAIAGT